MSFKIFNRDGKYSIHETDNDGVPSPQSYGTFDTEEEARAGVLELAEYGDRQVIFNADLGQEFQESLRALLPTVQLKEQIELPVMLFGKFTDVYAYQENIKVALDWVADEYDPFDVRIDGIGRKSISDTHDAVFVTYTSKDLSWLASEMDFLAWALGVPAKGSMKQSAYIGSIAKDEQMGGMGAITTRITDVSATIGKQKIKTSLLNSGVNSEMDLKKPVVTLREANVNGRVKMKLTTESLLSGSYPNIPLPADIDINSIPENERVFITLPIGQFNSESLNGHTYSEQAMRQMVEQINEKRPESNWGHIKDEDFGYRYNEPPVRWLAAMADENGMIWGKGRALTPESQRYYRNAKIDNARVGTSLFAWVNLDGSKVTDLELITIDLADPARVGVPMTAAKAHVAMDMQHEIDLTKEQAMDLQEETSDNSQNVENEVNKDLEMEKVQELKVRQALGITEEADIVVTAQEISRKANEAAEKVTELEGAKKSLEGRVTELETENAKMVKESIDNMIDARVRIPDVRELVKTILVGRKMESYDAAKSALEEVLALEYIKKALADEVGQEMGGSQSRPDNREENKSGMNAYFRVPQGDK